jgi:UDP-N-acetylmuramoyl-tripeptide--D-alanyl-D-alanine ligase
MHKRLLRAILAIFASRILRIYKPVVIVVTGSAGKTSTKEAIATVLAKHFAIRKTERNLNTEYGVPLTIIGITPPTSRVSIPIVMRSIFAACRQILFRNQHYPKVLVLELGADRPGDIRYFTRWLKPLIAVVTAIGEIPVHVEYYSGPEAVAREKSWVVRVLPKNGTAILNDDDLVVSDMRNLTKATVRTFGFAEDADIRIVEYGIREDGIGFKLFAEGSFVPIVLHDCFGKPHAYAAAAAAAVGLALGLNLVEIADALLSYQAPPGRMKLLKGIKDTRILDDTYNASPIAMHAALETLGALSAKRRIAVLGTMCEIGKYTYEAHEATGCLAATIADIIVTVGSTAKIIGEGAKGRGFDPSKLFHFDTAEEAGPHLQRLLLPGDLVLIKGSRAMHMEKIVEEIMAEPGRARELLVH